MNNADFKTAGDIVKPILNNLKPKPQQPESQFVSEFRKLAVKRGWVICPIPDPKGNYEFQNYRPFDFVLVTDKAVFCIEAKVKHNQLLSHQKGTAESLEKLNPLAYWIIRKRETVKRGWLYSVEKWQNGENVTICESGVLAHIVEHFEIVKGWEK